jgi:tetratricopeptide (TPR) repeat protein
MPTMVQIPGCHLAVATAELQKSLNVFPESFIYLFFKGKALQLECKCEEAFQVFEHVISIQKDWLQLSHVCYWEMGLCCLASGDFKKAASYYSILYKENKWSKAVWLYLEAICLYSSGEDASKIAEKMKLVPTLTVKLAGKSIPLEKYVSRKARKFTMQGNRLLHPCYELLYMWYGS